MCHYKNQVNTKKKYGRNEEQKNNDRQKNSQVPIVSSYLLVIIFIVNGLNFPKK